MKHEEYDKIIAKFIGDCSSTGKSKGKAYSGNTDRFENFKRNAARLGLTKYQIWAVYCFKHIDSIQNAIKENPSEPIDLSEGMYGRIKDVTVYLQLLLGMLCEDKLIHDQWVVSNKVLDDEEMITAEHFNKKIALLSEKC